MTHPRARATQLTELRLLARSSPHPPLHPWLMGLGKALWGCCRSSRSLCLTVTAANPAPSGGPGCPPQPLSPPSPPPSPGQPEDPDFDTGTPKGSWHRKDVLETLSGREAFPLGRSGFMTQDGTELFQAGHLKEAHGSRPPVSHT